MYTHNLHYFLNDQHYKIYSEHAQKYELHPGKIEEEKIAFNGLEEEN